jgi:16S rRNA (guanine527-N7)-methyltransferase
LRAYVDLLDRWRRKLNLVGPATTDELWTRHVADGLQLLPFIRPHVRTIVDLGSGAGIPGIVLALALPSNTALCVHLVESSSRKAAFLREAVRISGAPATVHCSRVEELDRERLGKPDLVTARALAPLPRLLDLAVPFLAVGAYALFHKGIDVECELTEAAKCWRITYSRHASVVDSRGCILEVKEISHV